MQTEFLIIGQGVSGTWLSYYLQKEKRSFVVIDNSQKNSASRVAAGIINPVTGRRIVKTWMIDELIKSIFPAYEQFGMDMRISSIQKTSLIDFHPTPQMKLAFDDRLKENADFLFQSSDQNKYRDIFNYDFGFGEVVPCYIVNLKDILAIWRKSLLQNEQLLEENFEINQLQHQNGKVIYKNIIADKLIFCDGISSSQSFFFKNLPFALNKGEAMFIHSEELPETNIFKKGMMLTHIGDNQYWIGSNYLWDFKDDQPSDQFRKQVTQLLDSWLKVPYKIVDHLASIRPANVERRPFVGFHPVHKNIGILNGMGTKGCSLAPYFAKQLTDNQISQRPILPEADINRFAKILQR